VIVKANSRPATGNLRYGFMISPPELRLEIWRSSLDGVEVAVTERCFVHQDSE
jgi:hypothetical protein